MADRQLETRVIVNASARWVGKTITVRLKDSVKTLLLDSPAGNTEKL